MMVNIEGYKAEKFKGIIEKMEEMPLRDYLESPEKVQAFMDGMTKYPRHAKTPDEKETYREARMDSKVIVVTYGVTLEGVKKLNSEFFNIPMITGWGRSKLKSLRENNNLPYGQTDKWVGHEVEVYISKDGYLRLLQEK